jgi:integrase
LTPTEVRNVLQHVGDTAGLIARLLYGSGMRLQECLRLGVKDIDFGNHRIIV